MELRAVEIVVPVIAAAFSGWFSGCGWRQLAGLLSAGALLWCLVGAFRVGIIEASLLAAASLFLAYPCGHIASGLRQLG